MLIRLAAGQVYTYQHQKKRGLLVVNLRNMNFGKAFAIVGLFGLGVISEYLGLRWLAVFGVVGSIATSAILD